MSGNVWEWVSTLYWRYPYPIPDSNEEAILWINYNDIADYRALRGDSWYPTYLEYLRSASRYRDLQDYSYNDLGFRCVVSLSQ